MGLARSVLQLILRQQVQKPWHGPVLTLGVQDIPLGYPELVALFRAEKVPHAAIASDQIQLTTSWLLRQTASAKQNYVHPRVFFQMLGLPEYDDLDFADFEKPTLVHDMNCPIPTEWEGKYGLVIDGGTTEHIFDVRSVLSNTSKLLRVGGDVFHVAPLSGWVNHGFYQLNPCLFYDFYASNGFEVLGSYLVSLPRNPAVHKEIIQPYTYSPLSFDLDDSAYRTLFCFRARKTMIAPFTIPIQGYYRALVDQAGRNAG